MNRKTVCFLVLVFVSLSTWLMYAQVPSSDGEVVWPRYQTEEEKAYNRLLDANGTNFYLWECFPELAGFTDPPPSTSRFPTESEQTNGVLFGWPSYGRSMPELTELIRNSIGNVPTTVMVPSFYRSAAESDLRSRGFTDDDLAQINWFIPALGLDGIWIRDYGPEILIAEDGSLQFIDMGYYSAPFASCATFPPATPSSRPHDDVSPTLFAPKFMDGVSVFRPQLRTEGGNLQTDGQGTCVHMKRDVLAQNNFSRWRYSQEELDAVYMQYFNCSNVITLESLGRDPGYFTQGVIDHVDMFMTFISPTKVLMGYIDPAEDPNNAAILDRNAQTLMDAGYQVVRIPQPARYCTVHRLTTCVSNPGDARVCGGSGLDRVWATYANSIRIGNKMMVPVYHDVPAELADVIAAQEEEALATFQAELDTEFGKDAVQVVPVESDRMIPCQGSVHCITMTY